MTYKVGDKVRVRPDLKAGEWYGDNDVTQDMAKLRGKEAVIVRIADSTEYFLDIDNAGWSWTVEMLGPSQTASKVLSVCDYCEKGKPILTGTIDHFNDVCLFGMKDDDTITFGELRKFFESKPVEVLIDRGHLRVTEGEDTACLDHSIDYTKITNCPMCGKTIN